MSNMKRTSFRLLTTHSVRSTGINVANGAKGKVCLSSILRKGNKIFNNNSFIFLLVNI